MSIQKKSLISTLKTAKKANVASAPLTHVESDTTQPKTEKMFAKRLTIRRMAIRKTGVKLAKKHYAKKYAVRSFAKK